MPELVDTFLPVRYDVFDSSKLTAWENRDEVHQALRPYLIEQSRSCRDTGVPLMRHLYLYDPTDTARLDIEDEYLLGDALLVAPVLKDAEKRDIYLPAGEWQDIATGTVFPGKQVLKEFAASLSVIAVFVRADSQTIDAGLEKVKTILNTLTLK